MFQAFLCVFVCLQMCACWWVELVWWKQWNGTGSITIIKDDVKLRSKPLGRLAKASPAIPIGASNASFSTNGIIKNAGVEYEPDWENSQPLLCGPAANWRRLS